ncbi:MAG: right-handed parallel beta-helix repeat-containing protein [Clostridia bacterium]|nr:right-handed parallel beta-helix repeat-containing protein [Clostridia bacterium]
MKPIALRISASEIIYRVSDHGVAPNAENPQTEAIQKILDQCGVSGGTVVFPKGTYLISGLLIHSHTTVYLESGAVLLGSEDCGDYALFDVPEDVRLCTDMELIPRHFGFKRREEYRRAMLSAYGAEDIAILGEPGSVIDGRNCFDPDGEENYRGPHGIFLSNCRRVTLRGYTAQHSGNFLHQLDACTDVSMTDVTCLGGSDGIHLHCCENVEIDRCVFRTGDDCIAGINIHNLHVNNCVLNSSCQAFRIGGVDILAENCHICGPGYYPHRVTIVRSKTDVLPREAGRHNLIALMIFFASETMPAKEHSRNIVFRNLIVENAGHVLEYRADSPAALQLGDRLRELTFDNVRFIGLQESSRVDGAADEPLTVHLKNVTAEFCGKAGELFDPASTNMNILTEQG